MITNDVVPRDADQRHGAVEAAEEREVIEHDITQRHAKFRVRANQLGDHVVGDVIDLRLRSRLRVTKEHRAKLVRLGLFAQREINRFRQRPGRFGARKTRGRRALRFVDVIKLGQLVRVERRHPATGLEHKQNRVVSHKQLPAPVRIRLHNRLAIGHAHTRESLLVWVALAITVGIVEYSPRSHFHRPNNASGTK